MMVLYINHVLLTQQTMDRKDQIIFTLQIQITTIQMLALHINPIMHMDRKDRIIYTVQIQIITIPADTELIQINNLSD